MCMDAAQGLHKAAPLIKATYGYGTCSPWADRCEAANDSRENIGMLGVGGGGAMQIVGKVLPFALLSLLSLSHFVYSC